jgi:hypothetical protein
MPEPEPQAETRDLKMNLPQHPSRFPVSP